MPRANVNGTVTYEYYMNDQLNMGACAKEWYPLRYLQDTSVDKVALVVLNQPLAPMMGQLRILWKKAVIKAVADGGINELHQNAENEVDMYLPDLISGDFDSADPKLLDLYRSKGCDVIKTPDQDYTDFTKCIRIIIERINTQNLDVSCIVALGGIGGRFDHTMANTNTMYSARQWTDLPIYLHSQDSLSCVLQKGHNTVYHTSGFESNWCGLIPIGSSEATVSTQGLKWNLTNGILRFGAIVSTSNKWTEDAAKVTVESDNLIVWTMGICLLQS